MKYLFCILIIILTPALTHGQVRILTAEEPPTNFMENGEITGTTVDIVEGIIAKLNKPIQIEFMPWARAMKVAMNDPNIAIFTAGRTQERIDHGFHFIGPVMTRKHVLWCKANKYPIISSTEDVIIKGYTVGALRGDWRGKLFHGTTVDEVSSSEQNPKKLMRGRIDLWVSSDIEAPAIMKSIGFDMQDIKIAYVIKEAPSYIMFSKGTSSKIIEQWEKALTELQQTNFFHQIAQKWKNKMNLHLTYQPETGFHVQ